MKALPTLHVVAGWASKSQNPRFLAATKSLERSNHANRGRIMVSKGATKIALYETPQSAIDYLEQQIAEIRNRFPQPKEQQR